MQKRIILHNNNFFVLLIINEKNRSTVSCEQKIRLPDDLLEFYCSIDLIIKFLHYYYAKSIFSKPSMCLIFFISSCLSATLNCAETER